MEFADEAFRLVRMSAKIRRQIVDDLGVGFSTLARRISERRDREIVFPAANAMKISPPCSSAFDGRMRCYARNATS